MDTKTLIVELIRELTDAANLAARMEINLVYLESIGDDISDELFIEPLFLEAQSIRSKIDKLNYELIDKY